MRNFKEVKDMESTIDAVIADSKSIEVNTIKLSGGLRELDADGIKELVEFLATTNPAWEEVLNNKRIGVMFDVNTGYKVCFNRK